MPVATRWQGHSDIAIRIAAASDTRRGVFRALSYRSGSLESILRCGPTAERLFYGTCGGPARAANGQQMSEIGFAQPCGIGSRQAQKAA